MRTNDQSPNRSETMSKADYIEWLLADTTKNIAMAEHANNPDDRLYHLDRVSDNIDWVEDLQYDLEPNNPLWGEIDLVLPWWRERIESLG